MATPVDQYKEKPHYKILRPSDGLFSDGGGSCRFTKRGKIWRSKAAVSSHLNLLPLDKLEQNYKDCVMVELVYTESSRIGVLDHAKDKKLESIKRKEQERLKDEKLRKAEIARRDLQELARLKTLYEQKG